MRVLIVKLSSLGDVVHTLPVVQDIVRAHPGALVDWVVEPGFAPLVRRVQGVHVVSNARCVGGRARGGGPPCGRSGGRFGARCSANPTTQ